jgi:hypothetical protein
MSNTLLATIMRNHDGREIIILEGEFFSPAQLYNAVRTVLFRRTDDSLPGADEIDICNLVSNSH